MIVLGLDGATFSLIRPWVEADNLPGFERLLTESVSGELESTVPEITVPAWPAFATGRDPPALDMYGFTHFNRETRELDLSHDEYVAGPMWDVIDAQGGRCVVFNIPGSYPWREIDGTIVAAAPEYKEQYSHPEDRWDELQELLGGYRLRNDAPPGSEAYIDQSLTLVEKRFSAFEHLIEEEEPTLAIGLIRATDRVAHHFWDPEPVEANPLFRIYRRVDEQLSNFLDKHSEEDIIVMSDHGFERVDLKFAPNHILNEEGLVALTDEGETTKALLGSARDAASSVLGKVGLLTWAREVIPESALTEIPTGSALGLDNAISLGRIDWDRSRAIADVGQKSTLIYALSEDPAEVDEICRRSRAVLEEAASCVDISVSFYRLERNGPHTPDLTMTIQTPHVHASSRFDVDQSTIRVDTSGHARDGIFLARGPSFRTGTIDGTSITDIAPTVLHALGYSLPGSMDGSVLDVFEPGSDPATRQVTTADIIADDASIGSGIGDDEEREAEVKDRLRELGYLE